MDSARHVVELGQVEGHEGAVYSLAWSPDGTRLASGSGRYEARKGDSPIRVGGVRQRPHPGLVSLGRVAHGPKAPRSLGASTEAPFAALDAEACPR
jgi:WD40 repeat protein